MSQKHQTDTTKRSNNNRQLVALRSTCCFQLSATYC